VGVSYPATNPSQLGTIEIPVAPLCDQRAIADFLDACTSRIDLLIAKKISLADRLRERRSALLSQAFVPALGDSATSESAAAGGISAGRPVGELPRAWSRFRLKYALHRLEQGWSPQCSNWPATEEEWGVLKVGAVNGLEFNPLENKALPASEVPLPQYEIQPGDFVMSRANTRELLGSAALVGRTRPRLLLCDKLYRLWIKTDRLSPEWLLYFLRSSAGRAQLERESTGSSPSMQNIGQETVRNLWIPMPPLDQQRVIAAQIARMDRDLERTTATIQLAIRRLEEYRAALITAAVTGQIDVRGEAP
jgi:type I restriction enzyme S subunit